MEFRMENLVKLGVDAKMGIDYTGGKDKYVSALQRYYKSSEKNKQKMKEYLEGNDLENFAITVHALKSNSKMIGAASLSAMFETLEKASLDKDMATIRENIGRTLEEYDRLLEAIKPWGEKETYLAVGELTADEARKVADQLLAALDDFDDDLATELANKLSGYPFRITQRGKLKEAIDMIGDFMYDEAADLIREILPAIE